MVLSGYYTTFEQYLITIHHEFYFSKNLFNKEEKVNIRVDFGVGRNTNGVYFRLEEAF